MAADPKTIPPTVFQKRAGGKKTEMCTASIKHHLR